MEAELDVFSGRPNPRWVIPAPESERIAAQLAALSQPADPPAMPGLGFRGFVLRSDRLTARLFGRRIVLSEPGRERVFHDTGALHADLAAEARRRGFASLLAAPPPDDRP
ncbi:MAG: hypothetical protein NTV51_08080 [Verrucomicrobia bacterium]|nr:hypothetical protein [Verrucomicrobiota bacterium]